MAPENNPLEKEIPIGNHLFLGAMLVSGSVPSRKLTYPTFNEKDNHLQMSLGRGYVSSLEGIFSTKPKYLQLIGHLGHKQKTSRERVLSTLPSMVL